MPDGDFVIATALITVEGLMVYQSVKERRFTLFRDLKIGEYLIGGL